MIKGWMDGVEIRLWILASYLWKDKNGRRKGAKRSLGYLALLKSCISPLK